MRNTKLGTNATDGREERSITEAKKQIAENNF